MVGKAYTWCMVPTQNIKGTVILNAVKIEVYASVQVEKQP